MSTQQYFCTGFGYMLDYNLDLADKLYDLKDQNIKHDFDSEQDDGGFIFIGKLFFKYDSYEQELLIPKPSETAYEHLPISIENKDIEELKSLDASICSQVLSLIPDHDWLEVFKQKPKIHSFMYYT